MRTLILAGVTLMMLSAAPTPSRAASAAPLTFEGHGTAMLVSGGCGPRGFRARNGYCYPRRPPPPEYRRRACPPGLHLTPYGCRRNF